MPEGQYGLVETLNLLASAQATAGLYQEALSALEEALSLLSDPLSLWRAATLINLANVHRIRGELRVAIEFGEDAMRVSNQLDHTREDAQLLHAKLLANLGALYRVNGEYERALSLLKEALAASQAIHYQDPADAAAIQFSLGLMYMDLGDYDSADPYLKAAMELTRTGRGTMHPDFAVQLDAVATWNEAKGCLAEAVRLREQAGEITKRAFGERHPNYGTSLTGLARVYSELGWHDRAEAALRHAAGILECSLAEHHEAYLQCIQNLGVALAHLGKHAEAERTILRALHIIQKERGCRSPEYAVCLHNLVMLLPALSHSGLIELLLDSMEDSRAPTLPKMMDEFLESLRDPDAVQLAFLEKVAEIESAAGFSTKSSHAATLINLGEWHRVRGNFTEAESYFQKALVIERNSTSGQRPQLATCLAALGYVCFGSGRPRRALALLWEAHAVSNHFLGEAFTTGSEVRRMQYLDLVRRPYHVLLSLVLRQLRDIAEAVQIAFEATLQRKGIAFEALAVQRDALLSGKYPHLREQLTQWRDVQIQIGRQERDGNNPALIAHLYFRKEELETKLAQEIPEMKLDKQLTSATWSSVAAALPIASALAEIVLLAEYDASANTWKEPRYIAFILSPAGPSALVLVDLGPAPAINRLIVEFQNDSLRLDGGPTFTEEPSPAHQSQAGIELRKLLFDPITEKSGGATKLFLATDGELGRVPFGALPTGDGRVLIDDFEFTYLTNGRDLLRFQHTENRESAAPVVVADPDFDFVGGDVVLSAEGVEHEDLLGDCFNSHWYFERLPGTAIEGEQVARLLNVVALTGKDALAGTIKKFRSPLVMHIATHGFFESNKGNAPDSEGPIMTSPNPLLRSGLALAGANCRTLRGRTLPADAEDGILTAQDITGMDLWGTELVVLSACETGVGEIKAGEGVYGLQRAAMQAGASTLIMSLWRIPDDETQQLMGEFYRGLRRGEGRSAALRQAQLMLRERKKPPALWASFVCYGNPSSFAIAAPFPDGKAKREVLQH